MTQFAAADAVAKVDKEAQYDPSEKLHPGNGWQERHLPNACGDCQERDQRDERDSKLPLKFGMFVSEQKHPKADDRKEKQGGH